VRPINKTNTPIIVTWY